MPKSRIGSIGWVDLTVEKTDEIREFYSKVTGWQAEPVGMGDYNDYNMKSPDGEAAAGICHARGVNAEIPPQWMIYITVENLDQSIAQCDGLGGRVLIGPKNMGPKSRYCIIEDPAGAVAALYEE